MNQFHSKSHFPHTSFYSDMLLLQGDNDRLFSSPQLERVEDIKMYNIARIFTDEIKIATPKNIILGISRI